MFRFLARLLSLMALASSVQRGPGAVARYAARRQVYRTTRSALRKWGL